MCMYVCVFFSTCFSHNSTHTLPTEMEGWWWYTHCYFEPIKLFQLSQSIKCNTSGTAWRLRLAHIRRCIFTWLSLRKLISEVHVGIKTTCRGPGTLELRFPSNCLNQGSNMSEWDLITQALSLWSSGWALSCPNYWFTENGKDKKWKLLRKKKIKVAWNNKI